MSGGFGAAEGSRRAWLWVRSFNIFSLIHRNYPGQTVINQARSRDGAINQALESGSAASNHCLDARFKSSVSHRSSHSLII